MITPFGKEGDVTWLDFHFMQRTVVAAKTARLSLKPKWIQKQQKESVLTTYSHVVSHFLKYMQNSRYCMVGKRHIAFYANNGSDVTPVQRHMNKDKWCSGNSKTTKGWRWCLSRVNRCRFEKEMLSGPAKKISIYKSSPRSVNPLHF